MEPIQQLLIEWWALADASTHTAVIVFTSTGLIMMLFMIIGANTNPLRRVHNEASFRAFSTTSLAANPPGKLPREAEDEPEIRNGADRHVLRRN